MSDPEARPDAVWVNGVSGVSGDYLLPPMDLRQLAALARHRRDDASAVQWFQEAWDRLTQPHLGLPWYVDPSDVNQAGWAVVFDAYESDEVKRALAPLIEHRRVHVGEGRTKVLEYQPGRSWRQWLSDHKTAPGNIDPAKVPYYLLLVGPPTRIPYEFQYHLDIEYAVGRLSFPEADGYRRYAESVVEYETAAHVPHGRWAAFFGPRHPGDPATTASADLLVGPLANGTPATATEPAHPGVAENWGYLTRAWLEADATKANLGELLSGTVEADHPALVFTATHGIGFPKGHPGQLATQGALLCQDWPGAGYADASAYFAASDLSGDARLHGTVLFHFACYSAGTPQHDDFLDDLGLPTDIAPEPFVAALPQGLLSHPKGTALAVIGHIDRAWGFSIAPPDVGAQLLPFRNALGQILVGRPVGLAMRDFNERSALLSHELLELQRDIAVTGASIPELELVSRWVERNDARNYVILGDPAVRLRQPEP